MSRRVETTGVLVESIATQKRRVEALAILVETTPGQRIVPVGIASLEAVGQPTLVYTLAVTSTSLVRAVLAEAGLAGQDLQHPGGRP